MEHRGPDSRGVFADDGVGLGVQRLAIIDLETAATSRSATRTAPSSWSATARSTTTASCARSSARAGHRFATDSDTEVIVHLYEELRRRLRRPPAGHVRLRALGSARAPAARSRATGWARSRSSTRSAAAGCGSPRSRGRSCWPGRGPARGRPRRRSTPSCTTSTSRRPRSALRGDSQAAAGPHADLAGRRRSRRAATGSSPTATRSHGAAEEELMRADPGRAAGGDPAAAAQRRAGRRDAVGRRRLERGGGGDGAAERRPGEDVLDRLRRSRLRRDRERARGRAHVRHRPPRGRPGARRRAGGRCRGSSGTTASRSRTPRPSPTFALAELAGRARDRGAERRRGRRELRRLPTLSARSPPSDGRRPSRLPPYADYASRRARAYFDEAARAELYEPEFLRSLGDGSWLSVMRGAIPGLGRGPGVGAAARRRRPDLSARRPAGEDGHRDDGALARGPLAAARPGAHGARRVASATA